MKRALFGLSLVASLLSASALAAPPMPAAAPLSQLVADVNIPHSDFTLPNGLRVIVHEDHKAPIVAVSVWYHIGSKDEPAGKSGFAHLYEHLMFYGSENVPGMMFTQLESIGATDWNGTTWFDRTNYFETVPKGALDRALFLESDRMGHLLGAVTQTTLDAQRGVVQNEKRMDDNNPGGLQQYVELDTLFPHDHPYGHTTIGSMKDLNGASLEDVKNWFRQHYGPNNAVLVLAGDIDLATAKQKVQHWFGSIPRGPETARSPAPVPTLPHDVERVMHDQVAATTVSREWVVPGVNDPDLDQLQLATSILGGLGSSRLDQTLVRGDKTAVSVSAGVQPFEKVSFLTVSATVRPGADPVSVGKRLDEVIADFLKNGPTADEVQRAATSEVASTIKGLEQVGGFTGKAVTLAEGAVYSNDPDKYKKDLEEVAAATPASVGAAARKWMGRPVFRLTLAPGPRSAEDIATAGSQENSARAPTFKPATFRPQAQGGAPAPATPAVPKSQQDAPQQPAQPKIAPPPLQPVGKLQFPAIERTTLSNGIKIVFARRTAVPVVNLALQFDAGNAADDRAKLGTQALLLSLLEEGTTTRDANQIAEEQERLGASIGEGSGMDRTTISLSALTPNLDPSLDLLADVVRNPAFKPADVERLRATLLTRIASEQTEPQGIALRVLPPMLYGAGHPYGVPFTGSGNEAGAKAVTRDDLVAFQSRWLRPDNLTIFAVGDVDLPRLKAALEKRFGDWRAPATPKGVKSFPATAPTPQPSIVLIDRPQSPQSMILGGETLPLQGTDDTLPLDTANDTLGGLASSRLIVDLRETKHWAYYAGTAVETVEHTMPMLVIAPVQTDKTAAALTSAIADLKAYLGPQGETAAELKQATTSEVLSLAGSFETSGAVLGALQRIENLHRPDDYYVNLPARYAAFTPAEIDKAARAAIDPARITWVIVGDAKQVQPQLAQAGLTATTMTAQ